MLQSRDLIAKPLIGQGAEIVPPGIALGTVVQHIQRLLILSETDVLVGALLVLVIRGLAVAPLLAVAAEGIVIAAAIAAAVTVGGRLGGGRILDLIVGSVDFLRLPGSFFIAGIPVRVVLICQGT